MTKAQLEAALAKSEQRALSLSRELNSLNDIAEEAVPYKEARLRNEQEGKSLYDYAYARRREVKEKLVNALLADHYGCSTLFGALDGNRAIAAMGSLGDLVFQTFFEDDL